MTLGPHLDPAGQVDQVELHFFQVQVQVEEVGMEEAAEWAWASWEAREDQAAASLYGGHHLALQVMPDLIISSALEECLALEGAVGVAVEEEVVDSPLVALLSSKWYQTSVHPCSPGQDSTPCCLQEVW